MNHRYPSAYLAPVQHDEARRFLLDTGLPQDHLLFAAATEPQPSGELLKIGDGGDFDEFCVNCRTGAVVSRSTIDAAVLPVNSSPQTFAACLAEFTRQLRLAPASSSDEDESETQARLLGEALTALDPTALTDENSFWNSVLWDVAIGDYAPDDDT
ncbi:SUKH-4 family immunity protein [Nonomuraea sp. NPDC050328]|uniref:SUKH-4 family immunity protein n=1 Tax=Nonomuraea sp. NPDC050328 TaxID=3364361 RepID=UPI0037A45C9F